MDGKLARLATALVVGAMAPLFDSTIVSVALHTLAKDLHTSIDAIQRVSTVYLLAMGVTAPVVGWLQNRIGGRRLWMSALVIFLIGSILCSLSWSVGSLIAFRAIQGMGAGIIMPLLTTLVMQEARGRALGTVMAVVALPTALGPILGPVIGGIILGAGDWPWLFWVNIPFAMAGLVLAIIFIPAGEKAVTTRLDIMGLALLSPAIVALLYGLCNASGHNGFARPDVGIPLGAGTVLLLLFITHALRRTHQGLPALVDLSLLRHRPLAAASALMFLLGAVLYGSMLLLPLSFQELRSTDPLGAGLLLIPQGVGSLLSRTIAGRLTDRLGARVVAVVGFTIVTVSTIPFAFADATTNIWWISAVLVVRGMGLGAVMIPIMAIGFVGLHPSDVPHASIITRLLQQIGGAFGTAVLAVVLVNASGSSSTTFQSAFWWAIAMTACAAALSFSLPGGTHSPSGPGR